MKIMVFDYLFSLHMYLVVSLDDTSLVSRLGEMSLPGGGRLDGTQTILLQLWLEAVVETPLCFSLP
jgi:hypothetical protein